MDERDKALIEEFKRRLPPDLAGHLKRLVIFGSRARGGAPEDSDLDVIALVDIRTQAIEKGLEDVAYNVMWDHDFKPVISLKVFDESRFRGAVDSGYSFYRQVEKEGVSV